MSKVVESEAVTVSVCLATFNGAGFVRQQIDSVLAELQPGDELLVADDGSTDETLHILEAYGSRLRLIATHRAGGVVKNFERLLAQARGDVVALCDQDDVWLDGRLALIRQRLRSVTLLMMNGEVVDGHLVPSGQDILQFVRFRGGFIRTLASNRYVGCCMAFRRELLGVALPFPSRILWHDWYLALIAELLFTTECSTRKTLLFRRHGANASSTGQRSPNNLLKKLSYRFWMSVAVLYSCLALCSKTIWRHLLTRALVLLAAYNGAEWIEEQVASILSQRGVTVRLVIGDDASQDATRSVIATRFGHDDRVSLLSWETPSGSAGANFMRLMRTVDASEFDVIALSDQDDLWFPDKLSLGAAALCTAGNRRLLIGSDGAMA